MEKKTTWDPNSQSNPLFSMGFYQKTQGNPSCLLIQAPDQLRGINRATKHPETMKGWQLFQTAGAHSTLCETLETIL